MTLKDGRWGGHQALWLRADRTVEVNLATHPRGTVAALARVVAERAHLEQHPTRRYSYVRGERVKQR